MPVKNLVVTTLLTAVLLPGFLLSYYGKERQNYFTAGEMQAVGLGRRPRPPGLAAGRGRPELPHPVPQLRALHLRADRREPVESWRRCWPTRPAAGGWLGNRELHRRVHPDHPRPRNLVVSLGDDAARFAGPDRETPTAFSGLPGGVRQPGRRPCSSSSSRRQSDDRDPTVACWPGSLARAALGPAGDWPRAASASGSRWLAACSCRASAGPARCTYGDLGDTVAIAVVLSICSTVAVGTAMALSKTWSPELG